MEQQNGAAEHSNKQFIEEVIASDAVWGLESEDGLAASPSNDYDETDVVPFWSNRELAAAVAAGDWADYKPESMPLSDFLENWLVGMSNDGLLVGTNWDAELSGMENEPLELALEISNALIAQGKDLNFEKFEGIKDYQKQVEEALEGEDEEEA